MPTRILPQKLTELGRLRIGSRVENKNGRGTHPNKLSDFRLTSPNKPLLHYAAGLYGGDVHPWEGEGAPIDEYGRPTQWELFTTANAIDVLIPTMSAASLSYELWNASGCQRRCTGEWITHCPLDATLIGAACVCPAEDQERAVLATSGKACARILRLNVLIPDLPGLGTFRLETKGFYATAELLGTLEMLKHAGAEHQIIEAVLRLEQRTVKRPGTGAGSGTLKFVVPVLWPKWTPRQLLAGMENVRMALEAPSDRPRLTAAEEGKTTAEHIADLTGHDAPPAPPPDETVRAAAQAASGFAKANKEANELLKQRVTDVCALVRQTGRDVTTYWNGLYDYYHIATSRDLTEAHWEEIFTNARHALAQYEVSQAMISETPTEAVGDAPAAATPPPESPPASALPDEPAPQTVALDPHVTIAAILALVADSGRDVKKYVAATKKRFQVDDLETLTPPVRVGLKQEVDMYLAQVQQRKAKITPPVEHEPPPATPEPAWRQALRDLQVKITDIYLAQEVQEALHTPELDTWKGEDLQRRCEEWLMDQTIAAHDVVAQEESVDLETGEIF